MNRALLAVVYFLVAVSSAVADDFNRAAQTAAIRQSQQALAQRLRVETALRAANANSSASPVFDGVLKPGAKVYSVGNTCDEVQPKGVMRGFPFGVNIHKELICDQKAYLLVSVYIFQSLGGYTVEFHQIAKESVVIFDETK